MQILKKVIGLVLISMIAVSTASAGGSYFTKETTFTNYRWTDGHRYDYVSCIDLFEQKPNGIFGGAWAGSSPYLPDKLSWSHTLPADLSVPPDVINRAKIWIDGYAIDTEGNRIKFNGTYGWDNLNNDWFDNSTYSLTNVKTPGFWNNGKLNVDVYAREWSIRIDKSILLLDYTNGDGAPGGGGAIPEPATMLLMGIGLAGAAIARKRK